jgi:hypothetical protein
VRTHTSSNPLAPAALFFCRCRCREPGRGALFRHALCRRTRQRASYVATKEGSAGERPPASPSNSVACDLSHMWGATPCIKIGFAPRLDLFTKRAGDITTISGAAVHVRAWRKETFER